MEILHRIPRGESAPTTPSLDSSAITPRAIGTALGVGMTTVKRDLAGGPGGPPDPTPVTGLDGKDIEMTVAPPTHGGM